MLGIIASMCYISYEAYVRYSKLELYIIAR